MARFGWLRAEVDGLRVRSWILVGVVIAAVVLGFGAWWTYGLGRGAMAGQDMGQPTDDGMAAAQQVPRFPPVVGYYAGERIFFIHTEASDLEVAGMLTEMMGSPVVVVPELTEVPDVATSDLYVFTNGVRPEQHRGPMGFQPDIFAAVPGDRDYRPLVRVSLVTWHEQSQPRVLTSEEQLSQAADRGQLAVEPTDVVVNAPLLTWPDGNR